MKNRDHAKTFITAVMTQPIAIRKWVADYVINRLPYIDATVGADYVLEKETGMSFVYANMIVQSWIFDRTKTIDKICFHYLDKVKWED